MSKKCALWQCEYKEDKSIVKEKKEWEKRFNFPRLWMSVIAKSLEEAEKKVKAMTEYKNKSI